MNIGTELVVSYDAFKANVSISISMLAADKVYFRYTQIALERTSIQSHTAVRGCIQAQIADCSINQNSPSNKAVCHCAWLKSHDGIRLFVSLFKLHSTWRPIVGLRLILTLLHTAATSMNLRPVWCPQRTTRLPLGSDQCQIFSNDVKL